MTSASSLHEKIISANGRRAALLVLLSSIYFFLTVHDALPQMNEILLAFNGEMSHTIIEKQIEFSASQLTKEQLPIYLLQSANASVLQTTWGTLVTEWNRTTTYNDLIALAKPISSLPPGQVGKRPVVMIHCAPKTGSTTLRLACVENLEKTCDVEYHKIVEPKGYKNETELYPLIRSCNQTSHFCTKGITMPMNVSTFKDIMFIHMFAFRMYDDWAASALKQSFDRGGVDECNKEEKLVKHCIQSKMEIDIRQYGKADLSKFKDLAIFRMNRNNESHTFILYDHRDLDKVLSMLSIAYNIPPLPGSNGKGKMKRPKGNCNESILEKFHDCFSSRLMELD